MYYETTEDNVLHLLAEIPAATKEQLCTFFSHELEPKKTIVLLQDLVRAGMLMYDENNDSFFHRFTHIKKPAIVRKYIDAFWPIAKYGSEEVMYVTQCYNPVEYFVLTQNDGAYTFTLCDARETARFGKIVIEMNKLRVKENEIDDDITHVAVCYNNELVEEIKRYDYDAYCVLNLKERDVDYV